MNVRAGFTAIELMVTVGIAVMLMAMTLPALARSMHENRIWSGAKAIVSANQEARRLAMERTPGNDLYGVEVRQSGSGHPSVVILRGANPLTAPKSLPANAVVYVGSAPLSGTLRWWCRFGSGTPVAANDPAASAPAVVGFTPTNAGLGAASGGSLAVSGSTASISNPWGLADYQVDLQVVAPSPAGGGPGLSVRGQDNQLRVAVAIYAGGLGYVASF